MSATHEVASRDLRAELLRDAPPEPDEARRTLHAAAREAPAAVADEITDALVASLWPHWKPALTRHGASLDDVRTATTQAARETWLWVIGERNWSHALDSLAGRVSRRSRSETPRS